MTIAARIRGDDWARKIMLTLEYDPEPPFVGDTKDAGPTMWRLCWAAAHRALRSTGSCHQAQEKL
ncbi:hypothetical protein [Roseobacter sp. GAI101]|uniref:hypothetical protein n=1 Tax=Roseobacter sp. (strain GAI101) TaxID=391589 RepID=UPI00018723CB|nr:hypothetical protein [Roseobacter sp. GAI101]EEB82448.1 hypothetical protein RGAI101_91 [Roseobacter sp. GAI101]